MDIGGVSSLGVRLCDDRKPVQLVYPFGYLGLNILFNEVSCAKWCTKVSLSNRCYLEFCPIEGSTPRLKVGLFHNQPSLLSV